MSNKIQEIVYTQLKETVDQEKQNITIRMATVTCPCGNKRAVLKMYRCLYCSVIFCTQCAEKHFEKTIKEYRENLNQK